MKTIEDELKKGKTNLDQLEVPEELEVKLRNALVKAKPRRRTGWQIRLAVACLALFMISYNFDTFAYFGKKLVGYDNVMNGALKELNELGKGQLIGNSYTFKNGILFTLDGIMIDESQLFAFYSLQDPTGQVDVGQMNHHIQIEGSWGRYYMESGRGELNEAKNQINWITSFKPPFFLEKKMHVKLTLTGNGKSNGEEGEITFSIDRKKAMGYTLQKGINETFKVEGTKVSLESIAASPTRTVINGSIQNIFELAMDQIKEERIRPKIVSIKLLANGQVVPEQGSQMSTDLKGITFRYFYDALPDKLTSVQIVVESLLADYDVKQKVALEENGQKQRLEILGQDIEINKVYQSRGSTYVTITTEETAVLTKVYLIVDGKRIELQETITNEMQKLADGKMLHIRTLQFPATGKSYQLDIERMTSVKKYNKIIDIPVN